MGATILKEDCEMKKALAIFISLLLIVSLAACGASPAGTLSDTKGDVNNFDYSGSGGIRDATEGYADNYVPAPEAEPKPPAATAPADAPNTAPTSDKIIYSAYAQIETLDFDASVKAVDSLVKRLNGFLESSSVTGSNYHSGRDYRSASYTIRIPAGSFNEVTQALSDLGNVTYCNTNAENITSQYRDTKGRLDAYQIEYDRLLDMLSRAETVEEMLSIESRLSEVRYHIESLTTTLGGWDSLVNYSTLMIELTEVKDLTTAQGTQLTYWQEVGEALKGTLRGLGRFFQNALLFLIASAPVLAILAVIAVAVIVIIKKRKAKKAGKDVTKGE